jgi:AraC-like DNA-binding protein
VTVPAPDINFTGTMRLYQLISIAISSSLFFLAIMTLAKKTRSLNGYRFLSVFFIFLSFIFADEAFNNTRLYTDYPLPAIIFQPVLYAIAPAFYLAVVYLTAVNKKLSAAILLHFLPYLILTGLYIIIYFLTDTDRLSLPDDTAAGNSNLTDLIFLLLLFAQIFIYLYLSVRKLKRHEQTLPLFVSSMANNDYRWIYKIIIGLSILSVIWLAETIFDNAQLSFYFSFIYLTGVYYTGIQVIRQKDVFPFSKEQTVSIAALINETGIEAPVSETVISDNPPEASNGLTAIKTGKKQVLANEKLQHYKEQLLKLMENGKPYSDSDITLPKLGKMLLLNTYQTSYLINTCFGENFYTFINRYRVEECKRLLESNQYNHLSILGIGYEAGFNSKTAFNTTFKKITGLTPKEYKDRVDKRNH